MWQNGHIVTEMWQKWPVKVFPNENSSFLFQPSPRQTENRELLSKIQSLIVCSTPQNTVSCNAARIVILTALAVFYACGTWGLAIQILENIGNDSHRPVKREGEAAKAAVGSWCWCSSDVNSAALGRVEGQAERNKGNNQTKILGFIIRGRWLALM